MPERTASVGESTERSSNITFETLPTADAAQMLDLLEKREAEEFGSQIDLNEPEESRTIRQIALKQIFEFLVDKNDARVANLRLTKRGVHLKLNVTMEAKTDDPVRVVIAEDQNSGGLLNLHQPSVYSETPEASKACDTTVSTASMGSETQTARLIPADFAPNSCDRLVALVVKKEDAK